VQTTGAGMVTADPLPTVQVNGVVWSQAVVGNKVFAGGSFSQARPAGAAPGTNESPRANLLAYDITTGALDTGFAPVLNGQVRSVVASPDGKRVYVAGDFTTINGGTRSRIAASWLRPTTTSTRSPPPTRPSTSAATSTTPAAWPAPSWPRSTPTAICLPGTRAPTRKSTR
jgi:hypothetical protein